jgi:hypothetical protein
MDLTLDDLISRNQDLFRLHAFDTRRPGQLVSARLHELAGRLDIRYKTKHLPCSALLVRTPEGTEVWLRESDSFAVRNFSLAHEIAHLIVGVPHDVTSVDRTLETKCNALAGDIAAPVPIIAQMMRGCTPCFWDFRTIARRLAVTLEVAAPQVARTGMWNVVIVRWAIRPRPGSDEKKLRVTFSWPPAGTQVFIPVHKAAEDGTAPSNALAEGRSITTDTLNLGAMRGTFSSEATRTYERRQAESGDATAIVWQLINLANSIKPLPHESPSADTNEKGGRTRPALRVS